MCNIVLCVLYCLLSCKQVKRVYRDAVIIDLFDLAVLATHCTVSRTVSQILQ